jgi:hypothetical protein
MRMRLSIINTSARTRMLELVKHSAFRHFLEANSMPMREMLMRLAS